MVYLKNIRVGDTVHLRCGGSIVVPSNLSLDNGLACFAEHCWRVVDGHYVGVGESPFDIISVTPKPEPKRIKGWVNLYPNATKDSFLAVFRTSKEDADENSRYHDIRIACIEIDVAEGEGL